MANDSGNPFASGATDSPAPSPSLPARIEKDVVAIEDFLPPYQVERLTEEQKAGLRRSIGTDGYLQLTPMICRDEDCFMYDKCPLVRMRITRPVGEECPVESAEIHNWQRRLFSVLPAEEQQDPFNVMLVNDIALLQLVEQRAMVKLAVDGGKVEQEITVGYTRDGSPMTGLDIHKGIQVYDKVSKLKAKLMGKLLQTPQDRVKAAVAGMHDRSQQAAKLMQRMKELSKGRRPAAEEEPGDAEDSIVEAKYTIKETPSGIDPPAGGF